MTKWILCIATLLCLGTAIHSSSAKELTLDDIFPTDRVIDVQITVSQRDWDTIRYQSRDFVSALNEKRQFGPLDHPYTYVEASLSIDGVVFPKVGLRKKGFIGSQSHTRPSLKIRLNHIDKEGGIEGLTNLTLNNNKQDTSQVSQFMGYALFNAIGSPAPRCAYAKVTVNGKSLGIYSHVETVRKPLLKRAFGNDNGPLYEGTVVDFNEEWENSFEHKRGNDTLGREKIIALINVLADDKVTEEAIGELVDLDSFYPFWATESLLGFWDGYSGNNNNYFIYLNPETDKFQFSPWGADALFTNFSMDFRRNARAPTSVKTQGLIAYRLYQLETGRERYAKTMKKLLEIHWNEEELLAELDRVAAMIQPYLLPEQREFQEEEWGGRGEKQTFENQLADVRDFIRTRKNDILQEIGDGMPVWRRKPRPPFVMGPDGFDMKNFIQLPEEGLWHAARTGDLASMKRYIIEGADVNEPDESLNISPLAWSASHGQTEATRLLIENGADVNLKDDNGSTPLHGAVVFGRAGVAKLLVENGANLQVRNNDGGTPADALHLDWRTTTFIGGLMGVEVEENIAVMQSGRNEIAKLFGVKEFDSKDIPSAQDLSGAVFIGDLAAVKHALTEGANANAQDPQSGSTMLSIAALMGHTEIVALLLEHGADVNAKSRDGGTALHAAAFLGRVETVKLLLEKGADTTLRNNMGGIAVDGAKLDWAFAKGIIAMLQLEVDEAEVKAGRAEVIKLLSRHSRE
ncbi:MAG: CotH kinase family protein [Candidatus Poribacteria bacterium]|nr:CotH kinase family protein [Candidatus Poribacteria bacterium]